MLDVVIIFFLASIFFYSLLGGADFGAGIVELFTSKLKKDFVKKLVTNAIAPVWEANHIWLIIAVVILFMGFPKVYAQISISLYIPLILVLIGIVFRGCAFTFRHYDAFKDFSQNVYSKLFEWSSLFVVFIFGLIIGALVSGKISSSPESFFQAYLSPWMNFFSLSIGIFLCCLMAFIASVFLIGDTDNQTERNWLIKKAKTANILTIISGGFVFLSAYFESIELIARFFGSTFSIISIAAGTISIPFLWFTLNRKSIWGSRIAAGAQLFFILSAFYAAYFPIIVKINNGNDLSFYNSAAESSTISALAYALIGGSILIFPALIYLLRIFKSSPQG